MHANHKEKNVFFIMANANVATVKDVSMFSLQTPLKRKKERGRVVIECCVLKFCVHRALTPCKSEVSVKPCLQSQWEEDRGQALNLGVRVTFCGNNFFTFYIKWHCYFYCTNGKNVTFINQMEPFKACGLPLAEFDNYGWLSLGPRA